MVHGLGGCQPAEAFLCQVCRYRLGVSTVPIRFEVAATVGFVASHDSRPLYEALADRLRDDIAAGRLRPGERLPSVRQLAETEDLAPGTVQQAMSALRREGLVEARRGQGTRVVDAPRVQPRVTVDELAARVEELAQRLARVESVLDGGVGGSR